MNTTLSRITQKSIFFIISLSFGWWLIKSGFLSGIIAAILPFKFLSEITAGVFYTSFLTAPVSVGMLFVLAKENNPVITALVAGAGAVVGDLLIIKFFRAKEVARDIRSVSRELRLQKISGFLKKLHLDFLIPALGIFIMASPFPDELGLMMLGASNLRLRDLVVLTYTLNTVGILLLLIPINLFL